MLRSWSRRRRWTESACVESSWVPSDLHPCPHPRLRPRHFPSLVCAVTGACTERRHYHHPVTMEEVRRRREEKKKKSRGQAGPNGWVSVWGHAHPLLSTPQSDLGLARTERGAAPQLGAALRNHICVPLCLKHTIVACILLSIKLLITYLDFKRRFLFRFLLPFHALVWQIQGGRYGDNYPFIGIYCLSLSHVT